MAVVLIKKYLKYFFGILSGFQFGNTEIDIAQDFGNFIFFFFFWDKFDTLFLFLKWWDRNK